MTLPPLPDIVLEDADEWRKQFISMWLSGRKRCLRCIGPANAGWDPAHAIIAGYPTVNFALCASCYARFGAEHDAAMEAGFREIAAKKGEIAKLWLRLDADGTADGRRAAELALIVKSLEHVPADRRGAVAELLLKHGHGFEPEYGTCGLLAVNAGDSNLNAIEEAGWPLDQFERWLAHHRHCGVDGCDFCARYDAEDRKAEERIRSALWNAATLAPCVFHEEGCFPSDDPREPCDCEALVVGYRSAIIRPRGSSGSSVDEVAAEIESRQRRVREHNAQFRARHKP